jgi:hypothetical protein
MPDDKATSYRKAAAECLRLARETGDHNTRVALLAMAQRWLEMVEQEFGTRRFAAIVDDFNFDQMRPTLRH